MYLVYKGSLLNHLQLLKRRELCTLKDVRLNVFTWPALKLILKLQLGSIQN